MSWMAGTYVGMWRDGQTKSRAEVPKTNHGTTLRSIAYHLLKVQDFSPGVTGEPCDIAAFVSRKLCVRAAWTGGIQGQPWRYRSSLGETSAVHVPVCP